MILLLEGCGSLVDVVVQLGPANLRVIKRYLLINGYFLLLLNQRHGDFLSSIEVCHSLLNVNLICVFNSRYTL